MKKILISCLALFSIFSVVSLYRYTSHERGGFTTNKLFSKSITLGKSFTLHEGEEAVLLKDNLKVMVNGFQGASKGAVGPMIYTRVEVKGVQTPVLGVFVHNYALKKIKTDYKSYATFVLLDEKEYCQSIQGNSKDECWKTLAELHNNPSLCENSIGAYKNTCYEYIAEKTKDSTLCVKVELPQRYCMRISAVKEKNFVKCGFGPSCMKTLAQKLQKGDELCQLYTGDQIRFCKDMMHTQEYDRAELLPY